MFNTDITHFLQQFDSPIIYWLMVFVSALGMIPVILTIILGITFSIDFKKGLVLINIVAWTALLTATFKEQINFPRPIDVDHSVINHFYEPTNIDLSEQQPTAFFEAFSEPLLEQTRNDNWKRYGLPSGHTSIQIALWFSLIILFRKRWIKITGLAVIVLTMISRLYLGHHFLGDVIGGALLGLTTTFLLIYLVKKTKYLTQMSYQFSSFGILWIPAFLIPFANYVQVWILGSMIGLNVAAVLIILLKNFPVFHIYIWKRVTAALLTLSLIGAAFYLNQAVPYSSNEFLNLLIISLINFVVIWGSIHLSNRLNLIRFRF